MPLTALSNFVVNLEKAFAGAWHQAFGGNVKGRAASLALDSALTNSYFTFGVPTKVQGVADNSPAFIVNQQSTFGTSANPALLVENPIGAQPRAGLIVAQNGVSTRFSVLGDGTMLMPTNVFPSTPSAGDWFFHSGLNSLWRYQTTFNGATVNGWMNGPHYMQLPPHTVMSPALNPNLMGIFPYNSGGYPRKTFFTQLSVSIFINSGTHNALNTYALHGAYFVNAATTDITLVANMFNSGFTAGTWFDEAGIWGPQVLLTQTNNAGLLGVEVYLAAIGTPPTAIIRSSAEYYFVL